MPQPRQRCLRRVVPHYARATAHETIAAHRRSRRSTRTQAGASTSAPVGEFVGCGRRASLRASVPESPGNAPCEHIQHEPFDVGGYRLQGLRGVDDPPDGKPADRAAIGGYLPGGFLEWNLLLAPLDDLRSRVEQDHDIRLWRDRPYQLEQPHRAAVPVTLLIDNRIDQIAMVHHQPRAGAGWMNTGVIAGGVTDRPPRRLKQRCRQGTRRER